MVNVSTKTNLKIKVLFSSQEAFILLMLNCTKKIVEGSSFKYIGKFYCNFKKYEKNVCWIYKIQSLKSLDLFYFYDTLIIRLLPLRCMHGT